MRVILADLSSPDGFVTKDTVVGGYGSRLQPFSRVTSVAAYLKKQFHDLPSVHMAYIAAILARAGHDVRWTRGDLVEGDVALVLSSLIDDLDSLPFPRWDLVTERRARYGIRWSSRPVGGGFPLLASRGCPEFCTYCPHRILAGYRARSIANIVDELERLCDEHPRPYVIFRDPLFTEQRDRCLELCDEIQSRGLVLRFEAETRLDRLDIDLLDKLYAAGFRAMSFGVESLSPQTLKRSGRR